MWSVEWTASPETSRYRACVARSAERSAVWLSPTTYLVVGDPDEQWGERVTAVVAPRPGPTPTLDDLRAHLRGRLASYKIPKQLILVDAVERSASGKGDYCWARNPIAQSVRGSIIAEGRRIAGSYS